MKKIDIDFQRTVGNIPSSGMALLVLAALLGIALLMIQRNLSNQLAAMNEVQQRAATTDKNGAANQKKSEGDQLVQTAFNQLTLPWGDIFAAVEDAANDEVLLLALEGDGHNREIRISAQAPDAEAMLAYLERLKSTGKLGGWRLLSHHEDDRGELHFVIQAVIPESK